MFYGSGVFYEREAFCFLVLVSLIVCTQRELRMCLEQLESF